jgi:hypothetical protein
MGVSMDNRDDGERRVWDNWVIGWLLSILMMGAGVLFLAWRSVIDTVRGQRRDRRDTRRDERREDRGSQ